MLRHAHEISAHTCFFHINSNDFKVGITLTLLTDTSVVLALTQRSGKVKEGTRRRSVQDSASLTCKHTSRLHNVSQEVTFDLQGVRRKADSDKKGRSGCLGFRVCVCEVVI